MWNAAHVIPILYEDEYLLIINKPSGLVINRSNSHRGPTVQDWMEETYPEIFRSAASQSASADEENFVRRSGVVHRLDKGTSGVLLLAKDAGTLTKLLRLFKTRRIEKEYLALVWGKIEDKEWVIDAPIARNPRNRMRMAIVEGGKEALTRFRRTRTVENLQDTGFPATLVSAYPKTGRTHQIRVHLSAFAHPVVGDKLYSGRRRIRISKRFIDRIFLHASKISFTHPVTGEKLEIRSDLPGELSRLI